MSLTGHILGASASFAAHNANVVNDENAVQGVVRRTESSNLGGKKDFRGRKTALQRGTTRRRVAKTFGQSANSHSSKQGATRRRRILGNISSNQIHLRNTTNNHSENASTTSLSSLKNTTRKPLRSSNTNIKKNNNLTKNQSKKILKTKRTSRVKNTKTSAALKKVAANSTNDIIYPEIEKICPKISPELQFQGEIEIDSICQELASVRPRNPIVSMDSDPCLEATMTLPGLQLSEDNNASHSAMESHSARADVLLERLAVTSDNLVATGDDLSKLLTMDDEYTSVADILDDDDLF